MRKKLLDTLKGCRQRNRKVIVLNFGAGYDTFAFKLVDYCKE